MYKTNLENSLSKSIPDIVAYSTIGFISGSIFENIMPVFNLRKDTISILLEVLTQLIMITFIFMFVNTKVSGRHTIVIFTFIVMSCQPTLIDKINLIQDRIFGSKILESDNTENNIEDSITENKSKLEKDEKENETDNGSTSITDLPLN